MLLRGPKGPLQAPRCAGLTVVGLGSAVLVSTPDCDRVCYNTSMSIPSLKTLFKKPVTWLYVAGVVIIVAAGGFWWARQCYDPENVFRGMLTQSLQTRGVTIQSKEDQTGASMHQTMQYSLGANNIARSYTVIEQGKTRVVTEVVGTTDATYNRYISVKTDQKNAAGKPLDVSKVVGVWAKTKIDPKNQQASPPLLSQAIFGFGTPIGGSPVPIGNLSPDARDRLLAQMDREKVYKITFKNVKKQTVNGRKQYTYDVRIAADAYVSMMKSFAKSLGLHDLDDIDAGQYRTAEPLHMSLVVDVASRHMVKVSMAEAPDATQSYSGYDVPVSAGVPRSYISAEELQKRLSDLR